MLFNLCLKNIKKSIKDYSIYFVTLVIAVIIFYVFNSIDAQESMLILTEQKREMIKALVISIGYVSVFISVILGFLIIYANKFLIKRRKKEIGLYLTLGMSKRKVSTILVIETLIVGMVSLLVGLILGVGLSQLLSIFTASLFEVDMNKFSFVFSMGALTKTIIYFSLIFLLVMIFNIITLSRYKLIDLLTAKRKNEKVRVKGKVITFITFALAVVFLSYAYNLLFTKGLMTLDKTTIKMLVTGALGTFLLFLSLSGFLLRIIEMNKKVYLKGLNMFILKQINNKINTTVVSTTIISLMLLLTIGILSGSMSLASVFNSEIEKNNMTDYTISLYGPIEEYNNQLSNIINNDSFKRYTSIYLDYSTYNSETVTLENVLTDKSKEELKKEFGDALSLDYTLPIISESDYNEIINLYKMEDLKINIKDDEYLILSNIQMTSDYLSNTLKENKKIIVNNQEFKPQNDKIISIQLANYTGASNDGTIVLSNKVVEKLELQQRIIIGNYKENLDKDTINNKFVEGLTSSVMDIDIRTKLDMEANSVGVKSIVIFLGLYLGLIFAISSATVLAINQLSEASDNVERYRILSQIGADKKLILRSLLTQISIFFMLPLVVALVHSYFGLRELNSLIMMVGNIDLASNIFITTIFILVVYGGYLLATYICSKKIIEEKIRK
ncbi:MAG: ABC transporter permease [Bacilli bacterium]|nr:ABC transporter permease [Bacilli bacterium]